MLITSKWYVAVVIAHFRRFFLLFARPSSPRVQLLLLRFNHLHQFVEPQGRRVGRSLLQDVFLGGFDSRYDCGIVGHYVGLTASFTVDFGDNSVPFFVFVLGHANIIDCTDCLIRDLDFFLLLFFSTPLPHTPISDIHRQQNQHYYKQNPKLQFTRKPIFLLILIPVISPRLAYLRVGADKTPVRTSQTGGVAG